MKKKVSLIIIMLLTTFMVSAQNQMRIWHHGTDTRVELSDITYSANGTTMSVNGENYLTSEIDSITMVHTITVTYAGNTATVEKGNVEGVTYTVTGADVNITSTNMGNELELVLQGSSPNGSLTYTGSYKCKFYLNGLNLTSTTGAALDIQCGKRVDVILVDGTENVLTDAPGGLQKAAFYCKGHVEMEGGGSLSVSGNTKHAIATNEYLQLKKSTGKITILNAVSDGMHIEQYFQMNGGSILIDENTLGDGIQIEPKYLDDKITLDPDKEENGKIFIKGGTIDVTMTSEDRKALRNDAGDVLISGGTLNLNAMGNGTRGIQTDGNLTITADDGETSINILAAGAKCTLEECKADPHRCMGIKVDGNLTVTGGTTIVKNTGSKSRGIKLGGVNSVYTKTGGIVDAEISY